MSQVDPKPPITPAVSVQDRLIKIGAKAVRHTRFIILQLTDVAVLLKSRAEMLATIADLNAKAQLP